MRERKKQRTRDDLTRIAAGLFAEHGYDAVTIDDIAAAADVSHRTFYRYFSSKEDLVLGDLNERIASFIDALASRPSDEPVLESIRTVVHGLAADFEQTYETNKARSALIAATPGAEVAGGRAPGLRRRGDHTAHRGADRRRRRRRHATAPDRRVRGHRDAGRHEHLARQRERGIARRRPSIGRSRC